jgi:hypothetical protein
VRTLSSFCGATANLYGCHGNLCDVLKSEGGVISVRRGDVIRIRSAGGNVPTHSEHDPSLSFFCDVAPAGIIWAPAGGAGVVQVNCNVRTCAASERLFRDQDQTAP